MLTPKNYTEKIKEIDLSKIPESIKDDIKDIPSLLLFYDDKDIKPVVDDLLEIINKSQKVAAKPKVVKKPIAKKTVNTKTATKKVTKPTVKKKPVVVKKTTLKATKSVNRVLVNHWEEDDKLIRRFITLVKKPTVTTRQVELLYKAISKAIVNRKVRKTDDDADLLVLVNKKVTLLYNEMVRLGAKDTKVTIKDSKFNKAIEDFKLKKVDPIVTALNSFINLQGTKPETAKAERLLKRLENLTLGNHRLKDEVKDAIKELQTITGFVPAVPQALSGLKKKIFKYVITCGTDDETYYHNQEYLDKQEAIDEANTLEISDFTDDHKGFAILIVNEYEFEKTLDEYIKKEDLEEEYKDYNLNDKEDYDLMFEEVSELILDNETDMNDWGDADEVFTKDISTKTEREEEEERERESEDFKDKLIRDFKKDYKDYIHHHESAGMLGKSNYFILLLNKKEELVKVNKKKPLFIFKQSDSKREILKDDMTKETRDFISREFKNVNKNNAVVQVRISDHQQNEDNIKDIIDKSISIVVTHDLISPDSQQGYENPESAYSTYYDENDKHIEYKMQFDAENSLSFDLDYLLTKELNYLSLIDERKEEQLDGLDGLDLIGTIPTTPYRPIVNSDISDVSSSLSNFEKIQTHNPVEHESKNDDDGNLVMSFDNLEKDQATREIVLFNISGDISEFLGELEIKPKQSLAITLDAPQGAGKTRFLFQVMNEFAKNGYKCLFASLEEHPQSKLFIDKMNMYISTDAKQNIDTVGELPNWYKTLASLIPSYDCIFVDSWNKIAEKEKNIDFDSDLRKKYDGKLFFTIFQRTSNGGMRGGSKAGFDGDVILKVKKEDDFRNSYVFADKNRYQTKPLNELSLNIYTGKLM